MLSMPEAAFDTVMRTEVWAKVARGGGCWSRLTGNNCQGGVPQGPAGEVMWSKRMLGLLWVMEGARARRVGDVLREWVGGARGAMYPLENLLRACHVCSLCVLHLLSFLWSLFLGKKKKFERYYNSVDDDGSITTSTGRREGAAAGRAGRQQNYVY
jgi:hypothetical protein